MRSILGEKKFIVLFLILFSLSGCNSKSGSEGVSVSNEAEPETHVIRHLVGDWAPDYMITLADELGYFKKNNVPVEIVRTVGYEGMLEVKNNDPEGDYAWCFTIFDALVERQTNIEPDLQLIYIQSYSEGSEAVLTAPGSGIVQLSDLKGKRVAIEPATIGEFFLGILLQREGMSLSDLNLVEIPSQDTHTAFAKGEIDAASVYEPAISLSVEQGATVLVDSKQERNINADVCVARGKYIDQYPELYASYVKSVLEAVDYYNEHPEEARQIIAGTELAKSFDANADRLEENLSLLSMPGIKRNKVAFDRTSGFNSIYNMAKQNQQFLMDQGVIPDDSEFGDLVDGSLMERF